MTFFIIGFVLGALWMFVFIVGLCGYYYYKAKHQAHLDGYDTEW
jgi:hypothetical protein